MSTSVESPFTREEFTFSFKGAALENHEIEVSLLADSLVAFRALAERSCRIQYGKDVDLFVKVKGGFKAASFDVQLLIDWATKNLEAAMGAAISAIGGTIAGFIKLYKWAKGKRIESAPAENGTSVTNVDGQTLIFNNSAVTLYNVASARADADKLTRPLEQPGIESLNIEGATKQESASVLRSEQDFLDKVSQEIFAKMKACLPSK